jgi:rhodanese-related sulfurtransferase
MKKETIKIIIIAIVFGALSGMLTTMLIDNKDSEEELIKDFYAAENAAHISPHHIRKGMDKGDAGFILVDLRSEEEYIEEHVIGAINIPAYKDRDHSDYGAVERITNSFKELKAENPDKELIVYCYSIPCMTGRKVGNMLAENDIYVKHLGVGWNEWRYYWELWNHPHEWEDSNVEDYVISGSEPGTPMLKVNSTVCPIDGPLGC